MKKALLVPIILVVIGTLTAANAADFSVGQKVFYKEGTKARVGNQERDIELTNDLVSFPATVEAVNGDLLWVGRAWLHKIDVLTADEALDYYSDLIMRSPSSSAYTARGSIWLVKGELEKAIEDCTEAIKLDGKDEIAHNRLGLIWFEKGEFDKAIDCFTEAIRLYPAYYIAYSNRGGAQASKGELNLAITDYTKAIELDPWYKAAYYNRGRALRQRGDFDTAIEDYSEAIKLDPSDANTFHSRGIAWDRKGDLDKAIKDFTEAIGLNPTLAMAFLNRGFAFQKKGDLDATRNDFSKAISLAPKSPEVFMHIARLRATCCDPRFRDGSEAMSMATKACRLTAWKNWLSLDTLAAAFAEQHDFESAVRWQTKAIDLAAAETDKQDGRKRLELYEARKPCREDTWK